jgi:voltage-gated potassium channel
MISVHFLKTFVVILGHLSPILMPLLLVISALGLWIGKKEKWPWSQALYFAFITATTVGYGDFHPTRPPTRVVAIFIALTGILFTGILVACGLHALQISMG